MASRSIRIDAAAGIAAAPLYLTAFGIQGTPPAPDEPTATIAEYLADHRTAILTGDVLIAVASAVFLWFLATLYGHLRAGGEERRSSAAALGGVTGTAIVAAGAAVQAALVLNIGEADPAIARFGFDAYNALITIAGAGFAVMAAATSLSAGEGGALPASLRRIGLGVALLQVATLPGLVVESKPFAAGGPVALGAFVALAAWVAAVSVALIRRA